MGFCEGRVITERGEDDFGEGESELFCGVWRTLCPHNGKTKALLGDAVSSRSGSCSGSTDCAITVASGGECCTEDQCSRRANLFLQKRVGKDAHCFNIIKFRTMKSTAPKNVATGDLESPEIYISKLGRILRDTSIDELPQLWNVVRGEMSLIGPRPLVYTEREIRFLRRWYGVYQVRPGYYRVGHR